MQNMDVLLCAVHGDKAQHAYITCSLGPLRGPAEHGLQSGPSCCCSCEMLPDVPCAEIWNADLDAAWLGGLVRVHTGLD